MIKVHFAGWWVCTNVQIATVKSEGRGHASIKHNNSKVSDLLFQVFIFIYPIYAPTKGTHHTRLIKCRYLSHSRRFIHVFQHYYFYFCWRKIFGWNKSSQMGRLSPVFLAGQLWTPPPHPHNTQQTPQNESPCPGNSKLTAMEINKFVTRCAKIFAINWKILACKFCSLFKQKVKMLCWAVLSTGIFASKIGWFVWLGLNCV